MLPAELARAPCGEQRNSVAESSCALRLTPTGLARGEEARADSSRERSICALVARTRSVLLCRLSWPDEAEGADAGGGVAPAPCAGAPSASGW